MSPSSLHDELDRLVASAREQDPPPLPELAARRMVREALAQAQVREQTKPEPRRFAMSWLFTAAALLLCGILVARSAWPMGTVLAVDPADHPLRVALLSGDGVTVAPGARLELTSQTKESRRMTLKQGTALFDVVKLRSGESFEVFTEHAKVRVMGTVFSVQVAEDGTLVRVYEGRVWVAGRVLTAGSLWSSRADAELGEDPLATQAAAAVRVRDDSPPPPVTVQALPDPPPLEPAPSAPPAPGDVTERPPVVPDASAAALTSPSLSEVRVLLVQGRAQEALTQVRAALAVLGSRARGLASTQIDEEKFWRALEGDALRALGRFDEATLSYERAASVAEPSERMQLGYDAASVAFHGMHDAARALVLLDRLELDNESSPLRERASRMRVHVLLALHRTEEARRAAQRYLDREPETDVSEEMRKLLGW